MNNNNLQNAAFCIAVSIIVQTLILTTVVNSNPAATGTNPQAHQNNLKQSTDTFSESDKKIIDQVKSFLDKNESPKTFDEANNLVQDIRNLYNRHQKNILFVQDANLVDLYKYISNEKVFQLARVDDEPFKSPINDEDVQRLQSLIEADTVVSKLYSEPLRRFVEMKKQQAANTRVNTQVENKNVFQQLWCKISDSC